MGNISTHFNREEFKCKCSYDCDFSVVDIELIRILEEVRQHYGKPVTINSACRCEKHNSEIGGSDKSQHKLGRACDIVVKDVHPDRVFHFIDDRYPTALGLGQYGTFTHLDTRSTKARWNG